MINYKRKLKKFNNQSDYEFQKEEVMGIPHVVLFEDTKEVIFAYETKEDETDYASQPFTLVALEDGTMNIAMPYGITSMHYTLNDNDWVKMTEAVSLTINANDKIKVKAIGTRFNVDCSSCFSSSMPFNAEGNIMSLLYGDDFEGQTDLTGKYYAFSYLFRYSNTLKNAKNLILPATTLANFCYERMFQGCESLTEAPELLATTLSTYCYSYMFDCCSSLNKITMLATDISADSCLFNWVNGVALSGTFVKNAAMTSLPSGKDGIPNGWTVENA